MYYGKNKVIDQETSGHGMGSGWKMLIMKVPFVCAISAFKFD